MQGRVAEIDQALCTSCGACAQACPQNAIFEYEEVPVLSGGSRQPDRVYAGDATPVATARPVPAVSRGRSALAKPERIAAAAVLLPALSRLLIRLAGRISLHDSGRNNSSLSRSAARQMPVGKGGRGGRRWRGGA